ncbi:Ppx/GppA phosphatase family protein [Urechidicola croceus]|uniref:Exopolyphosphatase n=1 Tax=Urechidicola croceus TaxID=1850246 RepID=A0A1D8P6S6_9FLAO|nr:rod shape-determining protein [Urechidicola croceus]AOW20273.1 exopolyphosphatase [Urechidicola croceus]
MLIIKKYAAIDIGSNAIRLLISNVIIKNGEEPQFKKSSLVRVPIRLGADTFVNGIISSKNKQRMIDAMNAFKLLMNIHNVEKYRACATSAMREASNGKETIEEILQQTGVKIDLIDGQTEAAIIFSTDLTELIKNDHSYLYVDVGGGSTELTVFSNGEIINSKSFKLGTVRLLNKDKSKNEQWKSMEKWIKKNTKKLKRVSIIGSGGNINKIYKMSGKPPGKSLSFIYLNAHYTFLRQMSYEERVSELGLNADRADVIIPATKIYLNAMKWCDAKKIFVPKIGLSDGIIKTLYLNS